MALGIDDWLDEGWEVAIKLSAGFPREKVEISAETNGVEGHQFRSAGFVAWDGSIERGMEVINVEEFGLSGEAAGFGHEVMQVARGDGRQFAS